MSQTEATKRLSQEDRRESILRAAGPLFAARGYERTRLDDVAAGVGVTKPVLYRHFDSKRDLYVALLARHRDDLASFAGLIPAEGTPRQRLRVVLDAWLGYVETHSYAWKLLFRDSGGGPEIARFRQTVHDRAREVLAEIIATMTESDIRLRELAPLAELMSMGMASVVLWWLDNPEVEREAILDAMVRVWAGLLAGER